MAKIERWAITSEAEWLEWRRNDVTASVVGALFGLHPYETVFGLYARATGAPGIHPRLKASWQYRTPCSMSRQRAAWSPTSRSTNSGPR